MSDSFNTTPTNWQGVDETPMANSNNLVKSGGVNITLSSTVFDTTPLLQEISRGYFDVQGEYIKHQFYSATNFLLCDEYQDFYGFGGTITSGVVYYDKNLQKISFEKSVDHFYKMYSSDAGWTHYKIDNTNGKVFFRVCADTYTCEIGKDLYLIKKSTLSNKINHFKDILGVLIGEPLEIPLYSTMSYLTTNGEIYSFGYTSIPEQYFVSDYIQIVPHKNYIFYGYSGNVVGNVCYYDSNKTFISCQRFYNITGEVDTTSLRGGHVIFNIPQNAMYFRCSAALNRPFYLTQNTPDGNQGNFTPIVDYLINKTGNIESSILSKYPIYGSKITVSANWTYGKYINLQGEIENLVGYAYTDLIPITQNMMSSRIIARGGSSHYVVNYYDENQSFIGGQLLQFIDFQTENVVGIQPYGLGFVDLEIPTDAVYIRLCCQKSVDDLIWLSVTSYRSDLNSNHTLFNSPKDKGFLKKQRNLAILGDSITWFGGDYCDQNGWTNYFKTSFMFNNIISFARGGATWTNTPNTVYDIEENTSDNSDNNVIYNQINRLINSRYVPDVIIIAAGTNDAWLNESPRGQSTAYSRPNVFNKTASDVFEANISETILSYDINTLVNLPDAIRYNIELLYQNFTNAQIILLSPLQTASSFTTFAQNRRIGNLIEDCAEYMSVPCIRQDKECGIWSIRENISHVDLVDGVHLNSTGAKKVGEYLAARLRSIIHD
jgi:lysophospholipase L1-like esterase